MSETEAPDDTKVRVLNPPNFLKTKTKVLPGSLEELLARAEKAVANLQGEFEVGTEMRLNRYPEILRVRWRARASREAAVQEFRRLNHDVKGEAGSFGYALLGQIADLFSDYLRETPIAEQQEEAIAGYVDALRVTWTQRIRGDGGALGGQLLDSLLKLNAKTSAEPAA